MPAKYRYYHISVGRDQTLKAARERFYELQRQFSDSGIVNPAILGNDMLSASLVQLSDDEQDFLRSRTKDRTGYLSTLVSEMKRLAVLS